MSEDCKKCNIAVPLIAHEMEMAKREKKEKKQQTTFHLF